MPAVPRMAHNRLTKSTATSAGKSTRKLPALKPLRRDGFGFVRASVAAAVARSPAPQQARCGAERLKHTVFVEPKNGTRCLLEFLSVGVFGFFVDLIMQKQQQSQGWGFLVPV